MTGDTELFKQTSADGESNETLLQLMVAEFDAKEQQTRLDWENKQPHSPDVPHCYSILDGWDAMEGSISGGGCRPSNNAMFYGNALAIAELASAVGNTTLAANFSTRARAIQEMYMGLLWNPAIEFFAVYKDGTNAKAGKHNATNGIPFGANSVDDRNAKWVCGSGHPNGDPEPQHLLRINLVQCRCGRSTAHKRSSTTAGRATQPLACANFWGLGHRGISRYLGRRLLRPSTCSV